MNIHQRAIDTMRVLGLEQINHANSGHGGMVLGAAPLIYATYMNMNFDPSFGNWFNRDRFVLSAGHGSALLYSANYLFGFPIKKEELKSFRRLWLMNEDGREPILKKGEKIKSRLHGHPELDPEIGIEATTGPLGQGFAMAVGLAVAEKKLNATYEGVVDHYTYCLVGDGCLMEGVSYEAANLAGLWKLNKLIVLYDSNDITLDGTRASADGEDVVARFSAANWNVIEVADGMSYEALDMAIKRAKAQGEKPSIIIAKTRIGHSAPSEGTAKAHGLVPGTDLIKDLRKKWGIEGEAFSVPDDVQKHFALLRKKRVGKGKKWLDGVMDNEVLSREKLKDLYKFVMPGMDVLTSTPFKVTAQGKPMALRDAGHLALQQIYQQSPRIMGANADISSTTKAYIEQKSEVKSGQRIAGSWFSHDNPTGTDLACGVREFGMAAICNGLALHGFMPYCSTFLAFSDYMRPAIRLAALMNLPVHFIFTHDGLGHAQDGPTHQGPEHLTSLRLIPNLDVFRPCDDIETANVYEFIYNHECTAVTVLSRGGEGINLGEGVMIERIQHGEFGLRGYVLRNKLKPRAVILATGTEVKLAQLAQDILEKEGIGIAVMSIPNLEIFRFEEDVVPQELISLPKFFVEMGSSSFDSMDIMGALSWNTFGHSGTEAEVREELEFVPGKIAEMIHLLIEIEDSFFP